MNAELEISRELQKMNGSDRVSRAAFARGLELGNVLRDLQPRQKCTHFSCSVLALTILVLLLSGCPLYNPAAFIQKQAQPADVLSAAAQVTLAWDPPATGPSPVSYTVSYRIHGTSTWNTLATVPASSQPTYTVLRSTVGTGNFDFAVAAVDANGVSSPLHTSLDPTADPNSGWYLSWGQ